MWLKRFEIECGNVDDIELVGSFSIATDALAYAEEHMSAKKPNTIRSMRHHI